MKARHISALFISAAVLCVLMASPASAAGSVSVSSTDMVNDALDLDGKTVVYRGEIVGDILYRGDFAWVPVSDGSNTISCYVSAAQADNIAYCGRYGIIGDRVEVTGIFHRDCSEHGGELDIHADRMRIMAIGHLEGPAYSTPLLVAACFALATTVGIVLCYMLEVRKTK